MGRRFKAGGKPKKGKPSELTKADLKWLAENTSFTLENIEEFYKVGRELVP